MHTRTSELFLYFLVLNSFCCSANSTPRFVKKVVSFFRLFFLPILCPLIALAPYFVCSYTASHYDSVLASEAPPSTPFSSVASLARGGSAPLPGTVFYPDHNSEDGNEGQVGDDNIDNASVSSKYTLGTRPPSELANFGSRSGISRGLFTGPRASAQSTRRDGHSHAHSHASPDARFHAEKFYQVAPL